MVKIVLRKPVPCGPLESDIGKVQNMSGIATKNKVYWVGLWCDYRFIYIMSVSL